MVLVLDLDWVFSILDLDCIFNVFRFRLGLTDCGKGKTNWEAISVGNQVRNDEDLSLDGGGGIHQIYFFTKFINFIYQAFIIFARNAFDVSITCISFLFIKKIKVMIKVRPLD